MTTNTTTTEKRQSTVSMLFEGTLCLTLMAGGGLGFLIIFINPLIGGFLLGGGWVGFRRLFS